MSVVKDLKKFQTYWWENYFKNETNLNGMNLTNYRFFNWFTLLLSNTKHRFQINKWENSPSLLLLIVIVFLFSLSSSSSSLNRILTFYPYGSSFNLFLPTHCDKWFVLESYCFVFGRIQVVVSFNWKPLRQALDLRTYLLLFSTKNNTVFHLKLLQRFTISRAKNPSSPFRFARENWVAHFICFLMLTKNMDILVYFSLSIKSFSILNVI